MPHELEDHDRGLAFDLATLLDRRRALRLFAGAGLVTLVGCSSDAGSPSAAAGSASAAPTGSAATCEEIPEETAGPYPGDGSNGPDVLSESGIVRADLRSSFGSGSGTAAGVPLTISLTVLDTSGSCSASGGAAVYVWHCDREGRYSLYSEGVTGENYLRGVQETDANGRVSFTSVFPACYPGRWPHVHFEVYESLAAATGGGTKLATSQIALPQAACSTVYATAGYEQSVANLGQVSLASDNVFGDDGAASQLGTIAGSAADGYTLELTVPV